MKNFHKIITAIAFTCALMVPVPATAGGLDSFLGEINLTAQADLGAFKADLSLTFGVSDSKVTGLFEVMSDPSDVYMCLRIGEVANQPIDENVKLVQAAFVKNEAQWSAWWKKNMQRLVWDEALGIYVVRPKTNGQQNAPPDADNPRR